MGQFSPYSGTLGEALGCIDTGMNKAIRAHEPVIGKYLHARINFRMPPTKRMCGARTLRNYPILT